MTVSVISDQYEQSVTERVQDTGNTFSLYDDGLLVENKKFDVEITGASYEKLKQAMILQSDIMRSAYVYFESMGFEISISKEDALALDKRITDCEIAENERLKLFIRSVLSEVIK